MAQPSSSPEYLKALQEFNVTASQLILTLLKDENLREHELTEDLVSHTKEILSAFNDHPASSKLAMEWAEEVMQKTYTQSIREMSHKSNGWHFGALHASAGQLRDFRIEDMAEKMRKMAPELWAILGLMLHANRRGPDEEQETDGDGDVTMRAPADAETEIPVADDVDIEGASNPNSGAQKASREERRRALETIKKVVMISIMMQGTNQKCNALESVIGVFLHSTNTPQKVIDVLAHMGVSISVDAIHNAVRSLLTETYITIRDMGRTLLIVYAYDNFDIDFKTHKPTFEKTKDTLTHLTSGTLIGLEHGVTREDLRCSEMLWEKSHINPDADPSKLVPPKTVADLENLHPEDEDHPSSLTRRQRYIQWKCLEELYEHGPEYFREFKKDHGLPEWVEKVPVVKMWHTPARAMDINQSKVSGNIDAMANLMAQGGVGDPMEGIEPESGKLNDVEDMQEYVILWYGDLGTGERALVLRAQRSIEETAYRRYQHIIFLIGLFHLKMACADAIWRIFLRNKEDCNDPSSLLHIVGQFRDRETGTIGSDPGFRRMHEVIQITGTALRLDAWQTELERQNPAWVTLDDFAATKPTQESIHELANNLACHYVAGYEANIFEMCSEHKLDERDGQHENVLLMNQYFLLYKEITFAMNHGDIGRLETLWPVWIYIFKATGKHKYASHMTSFMTDIHFVYPEGLKYVQRHIAATFDIDTLSRHAVRYNLMVNPTGKEGHWRGADWVEEANNMFAKVRLGHLSVALLL
ncbi:hypothetical protein FIBSPDRAFT_751267 [Athelia psychrophila]|uniref:DUF6589 domain-containing protein n=1 Tax=Athelia psychrophila TaxID=1759441 RepID=A0A166DLL6_9AGAM|nr:hypothetical protein FIBSPDRAFT_751267 [Fibularhizoctonia sp. CBS 109695]